MNYSIFSRPLKALAILAGALVFAGQGASVADYLRPTVGSCGEETVITLTVDDAPQNINADHSWAIPYDAALCTPSDTSITMYRASTKGGSGDNGVTYCASGCDHTWPLSAMSHEIFLDVASGDAATYTVKCIISQCD